MVSACAELPDVDAEAEAEDDEDEALEFPDAGKESEMLGEATSQNCCARVSTLFTSFAH